MVDEGEYQQTFKEVNHSPCVFGRAMLANCCRCQHGQRLLIAEREAMTCLQTEARETCTQVLAQLRHNARFSLKISDSSSELPHGLALRLQCGSLRGIRAALHGEEIQNDRIENVAALLAEAVLQTDIFEQPEILQAVQAFKSRKRRRS